MVNIFLFERILRNKNQFYEALGEKKGLISIILNAVISITVFGALYGATMGVWSWEEPTQILFSFIKVPLLFLTSISVVLPSYYIVNLAMGGRNSFLQLASLVLSSFSIATTILLAFVPVNLFFMITSPRDTDSYFFMILLNLIIFGFGGLLSIVYMVEGVRYLSHMENNVTTLKDLIPVTVALGTLAFIGTQMAWFIRPWFNYEPNFIRPDISGNFYVAVIKIIFSRPYFGIIFLFIVGMIAIPFILWITRILQTTKLLNVQEAQS
ncbi:MAG: hypothetical protein ACW981_11955 [Candidatus Hodarchaeales archaeon]